MIAMMLQRMLVLKKPLLPPLKLLLCICSVTVMCIADASHADEFVLVQQVTLYQRPPFYKGDMPLVYKAGMRPLGMGMDIVYWHKFNGWENRFSYSSVLVLESAKAYSDSGDLFAELKFVEIVKEKHRYLFREIHYSSAGRIQFECLSEYGIGSGFKLKETGVRGTKKKDFFFILPL